MCFLMKRGIFTSAGLSLLFTASFLIFPLFDVGFSIFCNFSWYLLFVKCSDDGDVRWSNKYSPKSVNKTKSINSSGLHKRLAAWIGIFRNTFFRKCKSILSVFLVADEMTVLKETKTLEIKKLLVIKLNKTKWVKYCCNEQWTFEHDKTLANSASSNVIPDVNITMIKSLNHNVCGTWFNTLLGQMIRHFVNVLEIKPRWLILRIHLST